VHRVWHFATYRIQLLSSWVWVWVVLLSKLLFIYYIHLSTYSRAPCPMSCSRTHCWADATKEATYPVAHALSLNQSICLAAVGQTNRPAVNSLPVTTLSTQSSKSSIISHAWTHSTVHQSRTGAGQVLALHFSILRLIIGNILHPSWPYFKEIPSRIYVVQYPAGSGWWASVCLRHPHSYQLPLVEAWGGWTWSDVSSWPRWVYVTYGTRCNFCFCC